MTLIIVWCIVRACDGMGTRHPPSGRRRRRVTGSVQESTQLANVRRSPHLSRNKRNARFVDGYPGMGDPWHQANGEETFMSARSQKEDLLSKLIWAAGHPLLTATVLELRRGTPGDLAFPRRAEASPPFDQVGARRRVIAESPAGARSTAVTSGKPTEDGERNEHRR
ncbi:hypothetical protein C8Q80DRAFT_1175421 [Daedaleopsis nitida]|nr:hypothetical protein C8Q80DRAFT_1175421 [Daedaleopsis nitida]